MAAEGRGGARVPLVRAIAERPWVLSVLFLRESSWITVGIAAMPQQLSRKEDAPNLAGHKQAEHSDAADGSTAVNGNAVKVIVTELMDVPVVSAINPPVVVRYVKTKMCAVRQNNTYHKLCGLILTVNLVLMILAAVGVFRPGMLLLLLLLAQPILFVVYGSALAAGQANPVAWAVGNVLLSVLFRNELFLWR